MLSTGFLMLNPLLAHYVSKLLSHRPQPTAVLLGLPLLNPMETKQCNHKAPSYGLYIWRGFINGSAPAYPGDRILDAAFRLDKPVVYLAMNYRLGIYGFPPGQQSEDAGTLNLGLKDQRLALEWVNKNIEFFGGDPTKVMIFGESAGAMSVGYQMMYKDGDIGGVFGAALMQSGSPSTYTALPASYPPRQAAYNFIVKATGCVDGGFECLRNANTETLKQANYDVFKLPPNLVSLDPYPTAVGPTLSSNDPFLSRPPRKPIQEGKFAKVPFICGTNLDEGTLFTTNPSTTQDVASFLTTQLAALTFVITNTTTVEQLLKYYPTDPSAGTNELRVSSVTSYLKLHEETPYKQLQNWGFLHGPISITIIDYWLSFAYKLNPSRVSWPAYGVLGNSLKLEAGNTTVIRDDFRSDAIDYIRSNILT
ncbi:hypothetical protein OPQ81_005749 [Rhizoctonia solani]|nr:hypothetical protein OPQ81_005749 [Rhizoctonia solani]